MFRYLRKVPRICGEFLADMPNDLPYILCCDWNFSTRVNLWRATGLDVPMVEEEAIAPSLAALWLDKKEKKVFWHWSEARTTPTVWNWSVNTLSPWAYSRSYLFFARIFCRLFRRFPTALGSSDEEQLNEFLFRKSPRHFNPPPSPCIISDPNRNRTFLFFMLDRGYNCTQLLAPYPLFPRSLARINARTIMRWKSERGGIEEREK